MTNNLEDYTQILRLRVTCHYFSSFAGQQANDTGFTISFVCILLGFAFSLNCNYFNFLCFVGYVLSSDMFQSEPKIH